jgi:hypothetical protein
VIARLATWLLGPRCILGCGERVYPRDLERHLFIDHAGDLT